MSLQLQGCGTALPECGVAQAEAARLAVQLWGAGMSRAAAIPALYRQTGVQTRYSVVLEPSPPGEPVQQSFYQPASDASDRGPSTAERLAWYEREVNRLAHRACLSALEDAGIEPAEIDQLITVSCSGFSAPGVDVSLIESLCLRRDVTRTHIGFMGCHGALNGLRMARGLTAQSPADRVLLCCVELCSLHQQYTSDPQQLVANALFSDGAAALVLGEESPASPGWKLRDQRSWLIPGTRQMMSWRIGNHGFEMSLSPEVPGVIQTTLRPWLAGWLSERGLTVAEIAGWAIHPGGPRILTACADGLNIDRQHLQTSQAVLAEFGNMSSPTVLFILDRLRRAEHTRPCVALAFGPGLTIEAALFD